MDELAPPASRAERATRFAGQYPVIWVDLRLRGQAD